MEGIILMRCNKCLGGDEEGEELIEVMVPVSSREYIRNQFLRQVHRRLSLCLYLLFIANKRNQEKIRLRFVFNFLNTKKVSHPVSPP